MVRTDRKLVLRKTRCDRHIFQTLQIDPIDSMIHIKIEDSVHAPVGEDGEITLQLLIAFCGRNKEFLLQGILIHRIMIVGNSRTALMDPAVHPSVNNKVDSAVLIYRKDLNAMFRDIIPDIAGCGSAKSKHSGPHISSAVISPQLPVCHERCVLSACALYSMDTVSISDSEDDPLSGKKI